LGIFLWDQCMEGGGGLPMLGCLGMTQPIPRPAPLVV